MTPPTPIVAGIDVGKSGLDAHILPGSLQRHFNNDQAGRRVLFPTLFRPICARFRRHEMVGKSDESGMACRSECQASGV